MRYEQIVQGNSSGRTELGPLSHNIVQKKNPYGFKNYENIALAGGSVGWGTVPYTKRL